MKELKSAFVFIDTSVFEGENFLEGKKIKKVFDLANEGVYEVVLPDITYFEIISRYKKGLRKAAAYLNENRKVIDDHSKMLRNIDPYRTSFLIPRVKLKDDLEKFQKALDEFFNHGKVHTLESQDITCGPIFKRYFAEEPPFHSNKELKKHEFPDAFAIATIERWCEETGQSCYALSADNDIIEYGSKHLIPINNIAEFIDLALRTQAKQRQKENIEAVDRIMKEKHFELQQKLADELEEALEDAAQNLNHPQYDIEDIEQTSVKDVQIENYSIIQCNDRDARVDIAVRFDFYVKGEATDYSMAFYDKEDERWWGEEENEIEIDDSMAVTINALVVHHPEHGPKFEEINVESIENGQGLDLRKYL